MALPDTKVAASIMKDLEAAIENANQKQKYHDEMTMKLKSAQDDLNNAMNKVDEFKNRLLDHLGTGTGVRQTA